MTRSKKLASIILAIVIVGGVTGCTTAAQQPEPSPSSSTPSLADSALTVLVASPGGVVAAGQWSSQSATLTWLSQTGATQWSDGVDGLTSFTAVAVAPDGDVAAVNSAHYADYDIVLFDASGTMQWTQHYANSIINDVAFTPDGNVVAVGLTQTGTHAADAWLLVLSPDGDQLTTRTFGGSDYDAFTTVAVTPDGGIVAAGNTQSNDGDLSGAKYPSNMIVRFTSDGTTQWVNAFGYLESLSITSSTVLPNGEVVVAGSVSSFSRNRSSGLLLAVGADGQMTWTKTYGTDDDNSFSDVTATVGGGLIAVGNAQRKLPTGITADQSLAVELDAAHNLVWAKTSGDTPCASVAVGGDGIIYTASKSGTIATLSSNGTPQDIPGATVDITPSPTTSPTPTIPRPSSVPSPMWFQHVSGSDNSRFESVAVLGDGTIAAAGITRSPAGDFTGNPAPALSDWQQYPYPYMSGLVALYSPTGIPLWVKSFAGNDSNRLFGVAATPDGGLVVVGDTASTTGDMRLPKSSDEATGVVMKLDRQGDVVWSTTVSGDFVESFSAVAVAGNGDIFATGYAYPYGKNSTFKGQAGIVAKLNANGKLVWAKPYGQRSVGLKTIAVTPDGGAIVGGYTSSTSGDLQSKHGQDSEDALVVKIDASGAMSWHQIYGTGSLDTVQSVVVAKDGTYVAAVQSTSSKNYQQFIIRLSKAGKTLSNHTVLQSTDIGSIAAPMALGPDGSLLLVAGVAPGGGASDYRADYVMKLDAGDQITWSGTFQPASAQYFMGIAATPDGNIVVCGAITTTFQDDALVTKIPVT